MGGPTTNSRLSRRPQAVAVGIALFVALATAFNAIASTEHEWGILGGVAAVGFIGALLVARRPANRVSWVLAATGVVGSVAGISAAVLPADPPDDLSVVEAILGSLGFASFFSLLLLLTGFLPLLFPTGHLPSPRWRWLAWMGVALLAVFMVAAPFQESFCAEVGATNDCVRWVDNPVGIDGVPNLEYSSAGAPLFLAMLAFTFLSVVSLVVRFVRARGVERQQLKWLTFTFASWVAVVALDEVSRANGLAIAENPAFSAVNELLWVAIPGSAALAILRYRLYDIDRIISRTLAWALISAVLIGIYIGGVVTTSGIARSLGGEGNSSSSVVVSTLLVATLFGPARRRIQALVDRRFNRARYDAQRTMAEVSLQLRAESDLRALAARLEDSVTATLQPAQARLWIVNRNDSGTPSPYQLAER